MQKKILSIILCMILCILPLSGCKKNVGTPEDNAVSPEEEKQEETEVYTFGYTCTTMADNFADTARLHFGNQESHSP